MAAYSLSVQSSLDTYENKTGSNDLFLDSFGTVKFYPGDQQSHANKFFNSFKIVLLNSALLTCVLG